MERDRDGERELQGGHHRSPAGGIAAASASAAVSVSARNWGLPHSNATPTYEDLGPDWGLFTANVPRVAADSGTGPWSGRHYVGATGGFGTMLRLVPDLSPDTTRRSSYGTRKDNELLLTFCENAATLVARLDTGMDDGVGKREATVWNHHSGLWYTEALVLGHEGSPCPS